MKLNSITIMVRDLEKSLDFYCGLLSLKPIRELNPPQGRIVFLADQPLSQLKKQAEALGFRASEISSNLPKPAHFTVTDPDGLTIELSET